jgi:hypothetical protein
MTDEERTQIMLTPYDDGLNAFWQDVKKKLLLPCQPGSEWQSDEKYELFNRITAIERLAKYPGPVREVWGFLPFPLFNDVQVRAGLQAVSDEAVDGELKEWAIQLKYYFPTSIVMQNASKLGTSYGKSLLAIVEEDGGIPLKRLYYLLTGFETDNLSYIVSGTLTLCKELYGANNPAILANGEKMQTYSNVPKFDPNDPQWRLFRD